MSKTFTDAPQGEYDRMNRIMRQYHSQLADNDTRVCITFVRAFNSDDEPQTALKFAGGVAHAIVKLISPERKLRIPFDAEVKIDGFLWDELQERQKDALIDHELSHVKIQTDAHGAPLRDDQNHIKLKLVPDDIVLTGFLSVIRHFGENALEHHSITSAMEAASQELAAMVSESAEATAA